MFRVRLVNPVFGLTCGVTLCACGCGGPGGACPRGSAGSDHGEAGSDRCVARAGCRFPCAGCAVATGGSDGNGVELSGAVQKGPFLSGSTVTVSPVDATAAPSGQSYATQTTDDLGQFKVTLPHLSFVSLEGTGFYYNEVAGALSTAPLTLRAYYDLSANGSQHAYLNVVTHLAYGRVKALILQGSVPLEAAAQAESEIRSALGIGPAGFDPRATGTAMNLMGGDTAANAYLFAVSSIFAQAAVTAAGKSGPIDASLQVLLNVASASLAAQGRLSSATVEELRAAETELDVDAVTATFEARVRSLGSSATVPDLNRIIDSDHDGWVNAEDNCPRIANPDQADIDDNGLGDACDCGDGLVVATEACDDGNATDGDGCTGCQVDTDWRCDGAPSECVFSKCGNGVLESGESCDAGPENGRFYGDGQGCSTACTTAPTCRTGGVTGACSTTCGDGNRDPGEECDDGDTFDSDGCSAACVVETGYTCEDQVEDDTHPCADTQDRKCLTVAVTYRDFEAHNVAGGHPDFFFLGAEATGGRTTGVVPGATKTTCVPTSNGARVPYTPGGLCPESDTTGPCLGLVEPALGSDAKPVLANNTCACALTDWETTGLLGSCPASGNGACTPAADLTDVSDCVGGEGHLLHVDTEVTVIQSSESFSQWYTDVPGVNTTVRGSLELATDGTTYRYRSSGGSTIEQDIRAVLMGTDTTLRSGFFPVDDQPGTMTCNIWPYWMAGLESDCRAASDAPVASEWDPQSNGWVAPVLGMLHNFYFTTEIRYLFRYDGGEHTIEFNGDDDVWVFINGELALDLGAPHARVSDSAQIDTNTGLEPGRVYEIAVFHAERHPRASNFELALPASTRIRSACSR